jgi:hypothetical protein
MISSIAPATNVSTLISTGAKKPVVTEKTAVPAEKVSTKSVDIKGFDLSSAEELPNKFGTSELPSLPLLIAGQTASVEKEREMIQAVFNMMGTDEISAKKINEFESKVKNGEKTFKNIYNPVKQTEFKAEEILKVLNLFRTFLRQYGDADQHGKSQQVLTQKQLEEIFTAHPKTNYIYGKKQCTSPTDRQGEEVLLTKLHQLIDSKYGTKPLKYLPFIGGDFGEQGLNDGTITLSNIQEMETLVGKNGGRSLGIKTVKGELLTTPTLKNMLNALTQVANKNNGSLTNGQLEDSYDVQKTKKQTVFSPLKCTENSPKGEPPTGI